MTSCVDSGIAGTISMESNLSLYCSDQSPPLPTSDSSVHYRSSDKEQCEIDLRYGDLLTNLNRQKVGYCEEAGEYEEQDERRLDNVPASTSRMDASIGTYSLLSSSSLPLLEGDDYTIDEISRTQHDVKADFEKEVRLLADLISGGERTSDRDFLDEKFVAKSALAEQICRCVPVAI